MRLKADGLVAGVPARQMRKLFRDLGAGNLTRDNIQRGLSVSATAALKIERGLIAEGYLERKDERGERKLTLKASAVANAKFIKPISRARADTLIDEMLARCRAANGNPDFVFYVQRVHVFGSYARDAPDVGDIDFVIKLWPRPGVGHHTSASLARARESGRKFSTYSEELSFGWNEVLRFVKNRRPHISIQGEADLEMEGAVSRVVFEATEAEVAPAARFFPAGG